jgi:hypothetical protein
MRKKNVMLNDEYNKIVDDRARYEVEYERRKKRFERFKNVDENENVESLDVSVESVRDGSVKINVSVSTFIATSKMLSDSFILTDDKDSNIEI